MVREGDLVSVTLPTATGQETVFRFVTHVDRRTGAHIEGAIIHIVEDEDGNEIEEPDVDVSLRNVPLDLIEVLE